MAKNIELLTNEIYERRHVKGVLTYMEEEKYDIKGKAADLGVTLDEISGLYSTYILEMRSEISDVKKFRKENNWDMLERISHNIKGVSANLGIQDVFEAAAEVNSLMKNKKTDNIDISLIALEDCCDSAEIEIIRFFTNNGLPLNGL